MSEEGEELKTFLNSVLQSQSSTDESWRAIGRGFGLYFLALLDAGVEIPHALHLTATCQIAIVNAHKPAPPA